MPNKGTQVSKYVNTSHKSVLNMYSFMITEEIVVLWKRLDLSRGKVTKEDKSCPASVFYPALVYIILCYIMI